MSENHCNKCGSNKIIKDARITDYSHGNVPKNLSIYIQKTDRIVFNKSTKGELRAQICGDCGDVQLTISNAHELWKTYMKSK